MRLKIAVSVVRIRPRAPFSAGEWFVCFASSAGADIRRIVAAGGGTQGSLWLQIVSDATGLAQEVPQTTIGASYGAAFLAAVATADGISPRITDWNPVAETIRPDAAVAAAASTGRPPSAGCPRSSSVGGTRARSCARR